MKVLLVNGSPHPNGSTNRALEEVASTLQDSGISTEIVWIGNKPISGCLGCGQCRKEKKCIIEDVVLEVQEKAQLMLHNKLQKKLLWLQKNMA